MVLAIEDLMVFGLLDLLLVWTGELVTGKKNCDQEKKIKFAFILFVFSEEKKRKLAEPIQPWWYNMQQWTVYYM